jgi:hypothetical protein
VALGRAHGTWGTKTWDRGGGGRGGPRSGGPGDVHQTVPKIFRSPFGTLWLYFPACPPRTDDARAGERAFQGHRRQPPIITRTHPRPVRVQDRSPLWQPVSLLSRHSTHPHCDIIVAPRCPAALAPAHRPRAHDRQAAGTAPGEPARSRARGLRGTQHGDKRVWRGRGGQRGSRPGQRGAPLFTTILRVLYGAVTISLAPLAILSGMFFLCGHVPQQGWRSNFPGPHRQPCAP